MQERERGREKKNKKHETSRISYTVFVDTSINLHRFSNLPETLSHLSLPTLGRAVKSTSMPQRFSTGEKRRVIFKWKSVAEKTKKISYVWRSLWLGEMEQERVDIDLHQMVDHLHSISNHQMLLYNFFLEQLEVVKGGGFTHHWPLGNVPFWVTQLM